MTPARAMRSFAALAAAAALPFGAGADERVQARLDVVPAPYAARAGVQGLVLELPPKSIVVVSVDAK